MEKEAGALLAMHIEMLAGLMKQGRKAKPPEPEPCLDVLTDLHESLRHAPEVGCLVYYLMLMQSFITYDTTCLFL